jgi:glycosyltransferase involved in cell wall biosynthesis
MVLKVFEESVYNFAVCQALKDEMVALGAAPEKTSVLRNGVDLELFTWSDNDEQKALKAELGIKGDLVVSVGGLVERKGHHLTMEAIANLPNTTLVIVGDGPEMQALEALAKKLNIQDRVRLTGALRQPEVNEWFKAADCSVLASSREGWANVLLESMASGCPVVATDVWGTPEVVQSDEVGRLCERSVDSIREQILILFAQETQRTAVRVYAESFDWKETSDKQRDYFTSASEGQK